MRYSRFASLLLLQAARSAAQTCFWPDGSEITASTDGTPCTSDFSSDHGGTTNEANTCCPLNWECTASGMCYETTSDLYARCGCTDSSFGTCPDTCSGSETGQGGDEAMLSCGSDSACCDRNRLVGNCCNGDIAGSDPFTFNFDTAFVAGADTTTATMTPAPTPTPITATIRTTQTSTISTTSTSAGILTTQTFTDPIETSVITSTQIRTASGSLAGSTSTSSAAGDGSDSSGSGVSTGATAGAAVGGALAGIILVLGILWFLRRRRQKNAGATNGHQGPPGDMTPEMSQNTNNVHELPGEGAIGPAGAAKKKGSVQNSPLFSPPPQYGNWTPNMNGNEFGSGQGIVHELDSRNVGPVHEMPASTGATEMPASSVTRSNGIHGR